MNIDKQTLRQWLDNLDFGAIDSKSEFYVKIAGRASDSDNEIDFLTPYLDVIENRGPGTCQIISGYIGTGKSSALLDLKRRLEDKNYFVFIADAANYNDLRDSISPAQFLLLLGMAFSDAAENTSGTKSFVQESYFKRFKNFLQTELKLTEINLPLSPISFKVAIKDPNSSFFKTIREGLNNNLGRLIEDTHEHIRDIVENIQKHSKRAGVVFILDSLERLRNGIGVEFEDVMESIIHILSNNVNIMRCKHLHTIYTVPPYIGLFKDQIHRNFDSPNQEPLPAIKLRDQKDNIHEPGLNSLISLLSKRIDLEKVFGVTVDRTGSPEHKQALIDLIIGSGGSIRNLLKATYDLILLNNRKPFPLDPKEIKTITRRLQRDKIRLIDPEDIPFLKKIWQNKSDIGLHHGEYPLLARYIESEIILYYSNGDNWTSLHPLVQDYVLEKSTKEGEEPRQET